MANPYKRRKNVISPPSAAPEIDFDAVCLPDDTLLEALETAEKALLTNQQQNSTSTTDTVVFATWSAHKVSQEHEADYSHRSSTTSLAKGGQNRKESTAASNDKGYHDVGDWNASLSYRGDATWMRIDGAAKASLRTVEAPLRRPAPLSLSLKEALPSFGVDPSDDEDDRVGGCLTQMVHEECHHQHDDLEQRRLTTHLVDMRKSLEKFATDLIHRNHYCSRSLDMCKRDNLYNKINALKQASVIPLELASAMHDIRVMGNEGAHHCGKLPSKERVESAFKLYVSLKQRFEGR